MTSGTKAIIATFIKTFIVAVLTQFLALGGDIFALDGTAARTILSAGIAATAMFAYNYFSNSFPLYGRGAQVIEGVNPPEGE